MTDRSPLGEDAGWYVENADKIAAFKNYLTVVEGDILPRRIASLVVQTVKLVLKELPQASDVRVGHEGDFIYWWFFDGGYDPDTDIGAWVAVGVPSGVDWLSANDGDFPYIGIYANGGDGPKGKTKSRKLGEAVAGAMKRRLPRNSEFSNGYYCVAESDLSEIITFGALKDTAELEKALRSSLREFMGTALPGLRALAESRSLV